MTDEKKWRWLCTECRTEGRGRRPDVCPECAAADSWYQTNTAADDPRHMQAVFAELFSMHGPRH